MTAHDVSEHHARLRAWAKGIYGMEAATELLIRGFDGRFADPSCPWIHPTASGHWIDFESIPELSGALSGGEQRFLKIAAALDDGEVTVNLGRALAGLDRQHVHLILAAVAQAAGTHQQAQVVMRAGVITVDRHGSMYSWDQPPSDDNPCRKGGLDR